MSLSLLRQLCQRTPTTVWRAPIQITASRFSSSEAPNQASEKEWSEILIPENSKSRVIRSPDEIWKKNSVVVNSQKPPRNAYSGRTVNVHDGDVASAAKKLDTILNNNSVGKDWAINRRHKPKGEERRKLISMRWRRRFKHEVAKKVMLVQQIRNRGA